MYHIIRNPQSYLNIRSDDRLAHYSSEYRVDECSGGGEGGQTHCLFLSLSEGEDLGDEGEDVR